MDVGGEGRAIFRVARVMELANGESGPAEASTNVVLFFFPESPLALQHDLCGGPIPDIGYRIVESVGKWWSIPYRLKLDLPEDVHRSRDDHCRPSVVDV